MYSYPNSLFDESDKNFEIGTQYDERGDQLQLVMLIMALGLALAAWGSLLGAEGRMRSVFSFFGVAAFISGIYIYLFLIPVVSL